MPLARAISQSVLTLFMLGMAACAMGYVPPEPASSAAANVEAGAPDGVAASDGPTARIPREIQLGAVDMVIQRVESNVTRAEVMDAIAPMIASAPVCMRWPALWIEQVRRTSFVVRYDLMTRDWGASATASAAVRMQEFVDLGFLEQQPGDNPEVVTYVLTAAGEAHFNGVLEPGRRPRFCAPAERRLVAIADMEWGQFPCGTLRVRFTHDGEAWPSWATSQSTRERMAATWPAANIPIAGTVSLSRQWFRRQSLPPGAQNGSLRSACYDARRQQIVGDDLDLSLGLPD